MAQVNKPDVLLLDEPTGDLDTRTTVEVMDLLTELNASGVTLVMVTHNEGAPPLSHLFQRDSQQLADLECYAHRVLCIRDGSIIRQVCGTGCR